MAKLQFLKLKDKSKKATCLVSNTYEEYVFIHKIKGKYHLGTYSIISHDGTNCELPKKVLDELFNTILVEEGSDHSSIWKQTVKILHNLGVILLVRF